MLVPADRRAVREGFALAKQGGKETGKGTRGAGKGRRKEGQKGEGGGGSKSCNSLEGTITSGISMREPTDRESSALA